MYRVFCESYINVVNSFEENSFMSEIIKPLELLTDMDKYHEEKSKESELYKKLCDLMCFMEDNIERFPRLKAFLWTLSSRNINKEKYGISSIDELEEQTKLINSILKLAYWY